MSAIKKYAYALVVCTFAICSSFAQSVRTQDPFSGDTSLASAHTGILVLDASSGKTLMNYQANKFFVPASNMKIITSYLAMKNLGDSIVGLRYMLKDTALFIRGTGDPTFLHPLYSSQPVMSFLKKTSLPIYIDTSNWRSEPYGSGWSWDDYSESYLAERSAFPVYGNVIRWIQERSGTVNEDETEFDQSVFIYSIPEVEWDVRFDPAPDAKEFQVRRHFHRNDFFITQGSETKKELQVPYITNGFESGLQLMRDSIGRNMGMTARVPTGEWDILFSQPLDSILKPMMKESDNFFAEQLMLLISDVKLRELNDQRLRDSLIQTDLGMINKKSRWADGSGLSRYNLFTPLDLVSVLTRMREEFGMDRMRRIFTRYQLSNGDAYAKTGTLSGVVAFSGYLQKKNGHILTFSVLINNHRSSASAVRRKIFNLLERL